MLPHAIAAAPVVALAIACGGFAGRAHSAAGDLDPSFGDAGVATARFTPASAEALALARQGDGKLVAAGYAGDAIAVARFAADGSLDASFGAEGTVVTDVGAFGEHAVRVLIQSDGKLVVAAAVEMAGGGQNIDIALLRYLADGSLDPSFGTGGIVITSLGTGHEVPYTAALQSDGKIVVAGLIADPAVDALVLRYDGVGNLDPGFGVAGVVRLDFDGRGDSARGIGVQADDKIVVAGTSFDGTFFSDGTVATLARLDAAGNLDPGFGTGGKVVESAASNTLFDALVLQPDGKAVTYGAAGLNQDLVFRLYRYDESGAPELSFAGGPLEFTSNSGPGSLALGEAGELVALGDGFSASRLADDGGLDDGFGVGGRSALGRRTLGQAHAVVVDPSGDLVLAGSSRVSFLPVEWAMTLVRLAGSSPACSDDFDCPACERCGLGGTCVLGGRSGCVATESPSAARVKLTRKQYPDPSKLAVRWRGSVPGFDPSESDDVGICLFSGAEPVIEVSAPAGGTCAGSPCWSSRSGRYLYKDADQTPDGLRLMRVTPDQIKGIAKGPQLDETARGVPVPFTLDAPAPALLLQIHGGAGTCAEATFDAGRRVRGRTIRATSD